MGGGGQVKNGKNSDGSGGLQGEGEGEGIHRNWMSRAIISISVIKVRTVFQTGVCYKCYRLVSISVPDRQMVA